MLYERIVISSGHGKHVRGASGLIDEVDEARKVVNQVADCLRGGGVDTKVFHDNTSKTQHENLNTIVNFHNSQKRDLDISVHFNAFQSTGKAMGVEVLYVTQEKLAREMSAAIADVGFINRGGKKRTDLFFLNHTAKPAILIEVCFVDSEIDVDIYRKNFNIICNEIAYALGAQFDTDPSEPETEPEEPDYLFQAIGKVSCFGGPDDQGVSGSEGLAFIYDVDDAPQLFLPFQPEGTTGLARRLNPYIHYVACRWDYDVTPKTAMLEDVALVRSTKTGIAMRAFPADWGPHKDTGRVADISPGLMEDLGIETDDEVEVLFPYRG